MKLPGSNAHPGALPSLTVRMGIVLAAVGLSVGIWTALVLGMGSPVNLVLLGAAALTLGTLAAVRWPVQIALCVPILIFVFITPWIVPLEIALAIVAVILGIWLLFKRSPWLTSLDYLEVAVWTLVLWAMLTLFWCRDTGYWLVSMRRMVVGGVALWVAWRLSRMSPSNLTLVAIGLSGLLGSLATLIKAYQVGWFESTTTQLLRTRATDLGWGTSNYVAAILSLILPTAIQLALGARHWASRLIGWLTISLTILVIQIAASRGGALMVLLVALFTFLRTPIKRWITVLLGTATLALLLLGPAATQLVERFSSPRELVSVAARIKIWEIAWQRVVDNWPLGMGHGQGWIYPDQISNGDTHNYLLTVGSELGLVGMVLWLGVLWILWRYISRMGRDPEMRADAGALKLVFLISQINMLFEPTFTGLQYQFLFYWIIGIYLGRLDRHLAAQARPPGPS